MPRLNLAVPEQVDGVLDELAALTGRSKASYALDALVRALPYWKRDLAVHRDGVPRSPVPPRGTSGGGSGRASQSNEVQDPRVTGVDRTGRPVRKSGESKDQLRQRVKVWEQQQKAKAGTTAGISAALSHDQAENEAAKVQARTRAIYRDKTSAPENGWTGR